VPAVPASCVSCTPEGSGSRRHVAPASVLHGACAASPSGCVPSLGLTHAAAAELPEQLVSALDEI